MCADTGLTGEVRFGL